ncbi:MAG: glycogen debranching enzyme family protein [Chitinophagales bacterium]|nr:glycogen debranching enzyme family protein [Chitinophagales bacterium]
MLGKDKAVLSDFKKATQFEWLETNGLGGWAGSSITGTNTRRYHGLLVAAIVPPAERMLLVSKLDETIVVGDQRYELGTNQYPGDTIHPKGYQYLENFTRDLFPQWDYDAGGVRIKKTIAMIHGENTTIIRYEVVKSELAFTLELLPLIAARGYHSLSRQGPQLHWSVNFENEIFHNQPDGKTDLFISIPGSSYQHNPSWYNNFQYSIEQYRGLDYSEDLFNHGLFAVSLREGDSLEIIISTENPKGRDAQKLLAGEKLRRQALISGQPDDEMFKQLVLAADQFIVKRDADLKTIIAGYHWFTDWGRDTMISLPGLCLSTGRFEDAKKIISAFARSVSEGMLPNRFRDNGELPEYNNADGTLWYFIAVYKYLEASGDKQFVLTEILPVLSEIIEWHLKGTRYNIKAEEDGLLYSGEAGQQLTWMDARIGTWVVTPRMGKPVEIQALWYNALRIIAELLKMKKDKKEAEIMEDRALKVKKSFEQKFWFGNGGYLYDNIDEKGHAVTELRPNQLFAISLPFPLIQGAKAKSLLKIIEEKLYTPAGLRSLAADDDHYIRQYGGDQWHRDSSYHQGTVWSWLLGAYIDGLVSINAPKSKIKKVISAFRYHLNEGCLGSVSEIFDAETPHHPRGCVAQAWGVAEVLRVIKQYDLFISKRGKRKQMAEV